MRYLALIFIFSMHLFAEDFFYAIVNDVHISKDFKSYRQATFDDYLSEEKIKQISIKMQLNKKRLKKETYYIALISDVDSLVYTNAKYSKHKNILIIKVDKENSYDLYFNYKYKNPKRLEFRFDVISEFEYKYMLYNEGILYGLAYGIIFCAFLYYIIIYFSTMQRAFLYYSIMQLFVLLSLIGFVYVSFLSYANQEFYLSQAIIDICETLAFLFTLLFAKEILETKKTIPLMDRILNLFIVLNILDIFAICIYKYSILYKYMAFEIGFLLPVIAGIMAIYKKVNYATIYTFGWFMMLCFVYVSEKYLFPISSIYLIHIAAPLESLIFSFALGLMLRKIVNEQNEKEKLLIHKNKLASMGEMINNIAHQWRQPLTHLSYINMNLQFSIEDKEIDRKYIAQKIAESNNQIDFMSNTIDNFKDFYKPNKEKEKFLVSLAVKKSIDIMKPLLKNNDIELTYKVLQDKELYSYENEYSQVVLNLISNAKDELIKKEIEDASIYIEVNIKDNKSITTVCDNAGGIKDEYMDKIFEPYFTTKDKGSGIGLYMSRTIISSHFFGELKVRNKEQGACFSILV